MVSDAAFPFFPSQIHSNMSVPRTQASNISVPEPPVETLIDAPVDNTARPDLLLASNPSAIAQVESVETVETVELSLAEQKNEVRNFVLSELPNETPEQQERNAIIAANFDAIDTDNPNASNLIQEAYAQIDTVKRLPTGEVWQLGQIRRAGVNMLGRLPHAISAGWNSLDDLPEGMQPMGPYGLLLDTTSEDYRLLEELSGQLYDKVMAAEGQDLAPGRPLCWQYSHDYVVAPFNSQQENSSQRMNIGPGESDRHNAWTLIDNVINGSATNIIGFEVSAPNGASLPDIIKTLPNKGAGLLQGTVKTWNNYTPASGTSPASYSDATWGDVAAITHIPDSPAGDTTAVGDAFYGYSSKNGMYRDSLRNPDGSHLISYVMGPAHLFTDPILMTSLAGQSGIINPLDY